jgi:hypothetical protein
LGLVTPNISKYSLIYAERKAEWTATPCLGTLFTFIITSTTSTLPPMFSG